LEFGRQWGWPIAKAVAYQLFPNPIREGFVNTLYPIGNSLTTAFTEYRIIIVITEYISQ
jgi:hypothetical protein